MRTRATRTRRTAWRALLAAASVAAFLLAAPVAAGAAPAPSPLSASLSGPGIKGTISFAKSKDPGRYNQLVAMVNWMDGQPGNIISNTPSDLGPDYTVKLSTNGKVTRLYDLYPLCPGGARSYRSDGGTGGTWFYAPINLVDSLTALGVSMAEATAPPGAASPRPAEAPTPLGFGALIKQSRGALLLAGFAAAIVLVMLAMAARVSRRSERRHTAPAAVSRLAAATARRTGPVTGGAVRSGSPAAGTATRAGPQAPVGAPVAAGPSRGTAQVRPGSPGTTSTAPAPTPWFTGGSRPGQQPVPATAAAAAEGLPRPGAVPGGPGMPVHQVQPMAPSIAGEPTGVRASAQVPAPPPWQSDAWPQELSQDRVVAVARVPGPRPTDPTGPGGPTGPGIFAAPAADLGPGIASGPVAADLGPGIASAPAADPGAFPDDGAPPWAERGVAATGGFFTATRREPIPQPAVSPFAPAEDPGPGPAGVPRPGEDRPRIDRSSITIADVTTGGKRHGTPGGQDADEPGDAAAGAGALAGHPPAGEPDWVDDGPEAMGTATRPGELADADDVPWASSADRTEMSDSYAYVREAPAPSTPDLDDPDMGLDDEDAAYEADDERSAGRADGARNGWDSGPAAPSAAAW
ncbi:MAG TPA: hypothetical protein VKB69_12675 [Micromonosporaceae bacterium]|nr:hypothetical protein [Micromonosporaceae bacterium]